MLGRPQRCAIAILVTGRERFRTNTVVGLKLPYAKKKPQQAPYAAGVIIMRHTILCAFFLAATMMTPAFADPRTPSPNAPCGLRMPETTHIAPTSTHRPHPVPPHH